MRLTCCLTGLCAVLLLASGVDAFIMKLYSLGEIMNESSHIVVGRVDKVDVGRKRITVTLSRKLKGRLDYKTVNINAAVGAAGHIEYLLGKLKPGADLILYYKQQGRSIACIGHSGGTWFQLFAGDNPKARDKVWWRFTHIEIHFPRTYDGPTDKLITLTDNILKGKAKSPKANPRAAKIEIKPRGAKKVRTPKPGGAKAVVVKGGFGRQTTFRHNGGSEVRGISWVDVNGDDRLDICLSRRGGNVLLVNGGDHWTDMARKLGLSRGSRATSWCDYNGDGHPDLLTSNFQLFTNVGGKLRDDSKLLPTPKGRNPEGAGWIDYNGDGRPDVLITNGEHGIMLYENTGKAGAWFRDVSNAAGLGRKGLGRGNGDFAVCFDYDGDGYTDLLYNLGDGVLARNLGNGRFTLDTKSGIRLPQGSQYKRGVAVADYDNDGDLDLFVPGPTKPRLYRNNNDGTFSDVFARCGDPVKEVDPCFAAAWGDVNADGYLDLFVCHTHGSSRLYLGDGKGRFTDISDQAGVRKLTPAYAASFADTDGDGDLDLVVNLPDRVVVALNDMTPAKGRRGLNVRIHARKGLVGAVVRVNDAEGRLLGMRELRGIESCGGQAAPIAHFGLPEGAPCRITVCLSDGRVAQKTVKVDPKSPTLAIDEAAFE
jgi:VCBS repeat protein